MSALGDLSGALVTALRTVPGLRVAQDVGEVVDPPAAILGPPLLAWNGYCDGPTSATFTVNVVVTFDERAMERLFAFLPLVAVAVDSVPDAVVTAAAPGTYRIGNADLPCYAVTVECAVPPEV